MAEEQNKKKEKKGILKEFKEFISKGNVIDLAVGVVVGGAFTAIVSALTGQIIQPLIIAMINAIQGGKTGLEAARTILGTPVYSTITDESGITTQVIDWSKTNYIDWGAFITAVLNFFLIAVVLFFIVKIINTFRNISNAAANKVKEKVEEKKEEKEEEKSEKKAAKESEN